MSELFIIWPHILNPVQSISEKYALEKGSLRNLERQLEEVKMKAIEKILSAVVL